MVTNEDFSVDLKVTEEDAEEYHVYKYEERIAKKVPRNWLRIEYYPDLFKLSTYKLFLWAMGMLLGIWITPSIYGMYYDLSYIYYKRNKDKLVFDPTTLTYSHK
jgi:hypothetical protein